MNYSLVKMDGDYRMRPPKWNVMRRIADYVNGVKYMPDDPKSHPDCLEIIEGDERSQKTVYKRNG